MSANVSPLIFSAPMIHALLREIEQPGTGKTQTRRVVNRLSGFGRITEFGRSYTNGYDWTFRDKRMLWNDITNEELMSACPWQPGDLLWARETFGLRNNYGEFADETLCGLRLPIDGWRLVFRADREACNFKPIWRPSIHMPRWASRLTLLVEEVRVQRVQDISTEDAKAEGCNPYMPGEGIIEPPTHPDEHQYRPDYWRGFSVLWDSLNAKRGYGWDTNPWVWALTFRPILANVDDVLAAPDKYGVAA